jgi:DNA modification methylase
MNSLESVLESITCNSPVSGLTHNFYRYPARFSPEFVRIIIDKFSNPGDVVLDPFMGGGTTLVEAYAAGRIGIGIDINELSVYVSKVKTAILSKQDISAIEIWSSSLADKLNLHCHIPQNKKIVYPPNMSLKHIWPIRKSVELALHSISSLATYKQQRFARCGVLKAAQWALDCKTNIPSAADFRDKLNNFINEMIVGMDELRETIKVSANKVKAPICLCRSTIGLETEKKLKSLPAPKLIVTSPPYPGVHVLYHRWQIQGRKETSAPYWISGCMDGSGASYYTFGDRKQKNLMNYFNKTRNAFESVCKLLNKSSLVVQMVAFSDPSWQLPKYLETLAMAGLQEVFMNEISNNADGRIWRTVPNRKWYADKKGKIPSSKEVVFFHRLT